MKLKEKELWLELYELADKIQKLEPWKYLWDMDLLVYISTPSNELYYCSVMGRAGLHKAVAIYNANQIHGFMEIAENHIPEHMLLNYQECIMCNFINRQATLPKNREIIKELGLSFRGTWISFENYEKGYEPSPINISQVKTTIELLKNFYMMFKAIIEEGIMVNFEKGEALFRHYDKEIKLYLNYPAPLMLPDKSFITLTANKDFENDMMTIPQTDMELEFEFLNYFPMRIRENKEQDGRNYYPRARFIGDRNTGFIISSELLDKNEYKSENDYIMESVDVLLSKLFKLGRPKRIYVRDEESKRILEDIADKAKIKLTVRSKLKSIDEIYKKMDDNLM